MRARWHLPSYHAYKAVHIPATKAVLRRLQAFTGLLVAGLKPLLRPKPLLVLLAVAFVIATAFVFRDTAPLLTGQRPVELLRHAPQEGDSLLRYTVQIMASRDSGQAILLADSLRRQGYWSYVLGPRPNSSWYRVRLGAFHGRGVADSLAAELREQALIEAWYVANFDTTGTVFGSAVHVEEE